MFNIRLVDVDNAKTAREQLAAIGTDTVGVGLMCRKTRTLCLKVHGISLPQANILKQEMLAIGADSAVHRDVLVHSIKTSDTLLIGTVKQLYELSRRLLCQQFSMKLLSEEIRQALSSIESEEKIWKFGKRNLVFGNTLIMGIINVTPDSFSDGGAYAKPEEAVTKAVAMIDQGAAIIDVGGESTRPGAVLVSVDEECRRVIPVIEGILKERPDAIVSVDTTKAEVAKTALMAGAEIVNDISGGKFDPGIFKVVAGVKAGLVQMHTRGTPDRMQADTTYTDFMQEVLLSLRESIQRTAEAGIEPSAIAIDPGIGFAKTFEHNIAILKHLKEFQVLGRPIVIGPSRKSFLHRITGKPAAERDLATMAAVSASVLNGANVVRVHNVAMAAETVAVANSIRTAGAL